MLDIATLKQLAPELILLLTATFTFIAGAFLRPSREMWTAVATIAYAVAGGMIVTREFASLATLEYGLSGPLVIDGLSVLFRLLAVVGGILLTLMASGTMNRRLPSEFLGSVMVAVVGVMLAARANDLVMLFLALEMVSIPTYILLFIGREGRVAGEATAKYFFLSVLSSALMLYGFSFLYGASGSTSLSAIRDALAGGGGDFAGVLPFAAVLILAGLGFKAAAAPFHFYAPDVYQGASNSVAAVLAVAPKMAGMAALLRIASTLPYSDFYWKLVIVVAIVTMTIGNVGALWQKNFRRMLAYSSIAHAGYMLIGVAVVLASTAGRTSVGGDSAVIFYLATYLLASSGAFAIATWLGSEHRQVSGVNEFAGLGKTRPATAAAMAIMMFSLAGIPPLAGFWGKLTLLTSSVGVSLTAEAADVRIWFVVLAVAGAINAAISAAYYLRIIGIMYFRPASDTCVAQGGNGAAAAVLLSAAAVVLLGIAPGMLLGPASSSLTSESVAATSRGPDDSTAAIRPRN